MCSLPCFGEVVSYAGGLAIFRKEATRVKKITKQDKLTYLSDLTWPQFKKLAKQCNVPCKGGVEAMTQQMVGKSACKRAVFMARMESSPVQGVPAATRLSVVNTAALAADDVLRFKTDEHGVRKVTGVKTSKDYLPNKGKTSVASGMVMDLATQGNLQIEVLASHLLTGMQASLRSELDARGVKAKTVFSDAERKVKRDAKLAKQEAEEKEYERLQEMLLSRKMGVRLFVRNVVCNLPKQYHAKAVADGSIIRDERADKVLGETLTTVKNVHGYLKRMNKKSK